MPSPIVARFYLCYILYHDNQQSIPKGEIFGLPGPFGAEKTTLIKILTGQLDVTSGTPTIHGIDSAKLCGSDYKKA